MYCWVITENCEIGIGKIIRLMNRYVLSVLLVRWGSVICKKPGLHHTFLMTWRRNLDTRAANSWICIKYNKWLSSFNSNTLLLLQSLTSQIFIISPGKITFAALPHTSNVFRAVSVCFVEVSSLVCTYTAFCVGLLSRQMIPVFEATSDWHKSNWANKKF